VDRFDKAMLLVALVAAVFAVLLIVRPPFLTEAWPFPETTELTYVLLASILAAAAASTAWAALYGERVSYVGIALDMLVIFVPLTIYLVVLDPAKGGGLSAALVVSLALAVGGAALLARTWGRPAADRRAAPRIVLGSFVVFVAALVIVGLALLGGVPATLPWRLTPELSVVCGLIFLGAAAYFLFGLWRPSWSNAGGQLAGFLAYDLVLIVPFVTRLPGTADQFRLGLVVYIAVLVYSGALATYYLVIDPRTRLRSIPLGGAPGPR
jgi:hypothetical protein